MRLPNVVAALLGFAGFAFTGHAEAISYTTHCVTVNGGGGSVDGEPFSYPDYKICYYTYTSTDTSGTSGGGSGSTSGGTTQQKACNLLLATRPQDCPNPIDMPTDPWYGAVTYDGSTALGSMQVFANDPNSFAQMRTAIRTGLENHTAQIAYGGSYMDTSASLRGVLSDVCGAMLTNLLNTTDRYADMTARGLATQFCQFVRPRFEQEAAGLEDFVSFTATNFDDLFGIDFTDLPFGSTIQNWVEFDNSLGTKFLAVTRDATCASWWSSKADYACGT